MRSTIFAACLALAACATSYSDMDMFGYGVEAQPMGGDIYRVTAQLNTSNTGGQLQDYLMLKAAETARDNGAAGFEIVSFQDQGRSASVVIAGRPTAYTEPGGTITIRLLREAQPNNPGYIDAAATIAAISQRIQRPRH